MKRLLTTLVLCTALPLSAQDLPEGWELRLDRAGADPSKFQFQTMSPGWHITTGPAGIVYKSDNTATGEYTLEAEIYIFPTNGRNREAYGVFVGGSNLRAEDQSYAYFLLRNDGSFLIKQRSGRTTETLHPWTEHDAIAVWESGEDPVLNTLSIEIGGGEIIFHVNDRRVATLPAGNMGTEGIYGLRVNHSLNLHVSKLEVTPTTN